jgi:hypothetical protein
MAGKERRGNNVWAPFFHTFLFSFFFPRADSMKIRSLKPLALGENFFQKYKKCDLETQIAIHTNPDT